MTKGHGRVAETSTGSGTIELDGLFAQLLGVWYPKNYVVAAIDATEGSAAEKALLSAGFGSSSIFLRDGAGVRQIREAIHRQRTPMQRAGAKLSRALTDEGLMTQEYLDEADAGASIIAVLAPEPRLVSEARRVLAAHGARHMRFFGDRTITDLV